MLIETHEPPPESPQGKPRPSWPLALLRLSWRLVFGLVLVLVSGTFPPLEAYAVLLAACVLIGRGLATIVHATPGLKDHRQ